MELTADNVETVVNACLFKTEPEDKTTNVLLCEGIVNKFGFNPANVAEQAENIHSMLEQLPESFFVSSGGGMSFLAACNDKNGKQWGQHHNMEALFCLGIAVKRVKECLPRSMWEALPGGMPYYQISDREQEAGSNAAA